MVDNNKVAHAFTMKLFKGLAVALAAMFTLIANPGYAAVEKIVARSHGSIGSYSDRNYIWVDGITGINELRLLKDLKVYHVLLKCIKKVNRIPRTFQLIDPFPPTKHK